jgi:16S rRNA G966 N2-methylase RsmD
MKVAFLADKVFSPLCAEARRKVHYDWVSVYSASSHKAATLIANIMCNYIDADSVVTDATAGIGGNTLVFSNRFKQVHAVESHGNRFPMLCHNMNLAGTSNIRFYHADYLKLCWTLDQDAIFLDPPWGGPEIYLARATQLYLSGIPIEYVCHRLMGHAKIIAVKVPPSYDSQPMRTMLRDYHVHVYRLRKMHLIVCSHHSVPGRPP